MYYYDFTGAVSGNYCQTEDDIVLYFLGVNENGEKVEKTNIAGFERTITSGVDNGVPFVESDGVSVSRKSDEFKRVTSVETEDTQKMPYSLQTMSTQAEILQIQQHLL